MMVRTTLVMLGFVAGVALQPALAQPHQLGTAVRAAVESDRPSTTIEITDQFADYVRQVTNSDSRVFADVSTLKSYAQAGCKRLRIVVRAPDAAAVDAATGERRSFAFTYEMDLCADGSPPLKR